MEQSQHLRYEFIDKSDIEFIKSLFGSEDVRKFYILREDHSKDLSLFVDYLVNAHRNQTSLNYKIMLLNGTPIGIIGGELQRDFNNNVAWNVSYAILPAYRNRGYATEALCSFTNEISKYSISSAFLDISVLNTYSEKVADNAGYVKNHRVGHIDPKHEELDVLFHWEKKFHSQRDVYFQMGINAFRSKKYREAEKYFAQALEEEYNGNPNTDALCYSNMGMACSSYGNYNKAFQCLKKAQSLGLTNPSIERELRWLRDNVGLF